MYTTRTLGYSYTEAVAVFRNKMTEWKRKCYLRDYTDHDWTFNELVKWYIELLDGSLLKTKSKIAAHCETLKNYFGHLKVADIRPSMVEQYRGERLKTKSKHGKFYRPASINREVEVLKRIFNLAVRDKHAESNPCFKLARLPEDNIRNRVLSADELKRLAAALPEHAVQLVTIGYLTGMLYGEIVNLTWDRVNLKQNYFTLTEKDTKTRKPRIVYFNNTVREILKQIEKDRVRDTTRVFTYKGNPIGRIKKALASACEKAAIRDFRFHDLRRTCVTNLRKAGVNQTVIMKVTGHKTFSMFTRYDTVDISDAQDAVRKLDKFLENMDGTASNMP
jgi:integrase